MQHVFCILRGEIFLIAVLLIPTVLLFKMFFSLIVMPSLSCCPTNISEIMICCIKNRSVLWWRCIIHKAEIALKLLFSDHRQGRVQPLITVSAVVGALWVKLEPFFGWRCHIIPVVTPLLYPACTLLEPPSSFPFVCYLTSCCCICHTPFSDSSSFFPSFSVPRSLP